MSKSLRASSFLGVSFIIMISFTALISCEKYSSPRKVNRLLTQGSWVISHAYVDNVDISDSYVNYRFQFNESGNIVIVGDSTVSGRWHTGVDKNPALLSITITPFLPFYHLNADWTFTTCTKDRMSLELNGGSSIDVIVLDKVSEI